MILVCVDAQHWLATVFAPALDRESLAYTNDADLLRGQLAALYDCDVLDEQAHSDARRRLDVAVEAARQRVHLDIRPAGIAAVAVATVPLAEGRRRGKPAGGLRQVLAVARPLVVIDGMPFVLTSIELWTNRIDLFLAGQPAAESQRHIGHHEDELNDWAHKRRQGLNGERTLSPPQMRSSQLFEVDIRLRDDVGTDYQTMGGSAGGSQTEWRLHRHYEPGLPEHATQLAVEAADHDGHVIAAVELPLGTPPNANTSRDL
jgi:hypothetical protein